MHVMHAPVPAAAEDDARQMLHPAAAVGGLAPVRVLCIVTEATNVEKTQSEELRKIVFLQAK